MALPCDNCGHPKDNHLYEEGACRPGFPCNCKKFITDPACEICGKTSIGYLALCDEHATRRFNLTYGNKPITLEDLPKCCAVRHPVNRNVSYWDGHHKPPLRWNNDPENYLDGRFLTEAQAQEYIALKAENAKLREALQTFDLIPWIMVKRTDDHDAGWLASGEEHSPRDIAQRALEAKP